MEVKNLKTEGKFLSRVTKQVGLSYDKSRINSNIRKEKKKIDLLHGKFKDDLKVLTKSSFDSEDQLAKIAITEDIFYEYSKILNGVAIKTTPLVAKQIEGLDYVKGIRREEKFEYNLNKAGKIINANYVQDNLIDSEQVPLTGRNIRIAVIDTGVDYTHPDLGGCNTKEFLERDCEKVVAGYDFGENDPDPMDYSGHGTHVAGIVAGTGEGSDGKYKGIAPDAKIYAYKVEKDKSLSESAILSSWEAITDLNGNGIPFEDKDDRVDIVSMSFGNGYIHSPDSYAAKGVDDLVKGGIVAVVAVGNDGNIGYGTVSSPGTSRYAITVGSSTHVEDSKDSGGSDKISWFSSKGPTDAGTHKPDIVAPGGDVHVRIIDKGVDSSKVYEYHDGIIAPFSSNVKDDQNLCFIHDKFTSECVDGNYIIDDIYIKASGTSMSTPMVSGAVALLLQKNPDWTPLEIKAALKNNAIDIGYNIDTQGAGRLDIKEAIPLTPGDNSPPPVALLFGFSDRVRNQSSVYIRGLVQSRNFKKYSLFYNEKGSDEKILFFESYKLPDSDILASLDIPRFISTSYEIIIEVEDIYGKKSQDSVSLQLENTYIDYIEIDEEGIAHVYGTVAQNVDTYYLNISESSFTVDHAYKGNGGFSGEIASFDVKLFFNGFLWTSLEAYDSDGNPIETGEGYRIFLNNIYFTSIKDGSNVVWDDVFDIRATVKNPNYGSLKAYLYGHGNKRELDLVQNLPKTFEDIKIAELKMDDFEIGKEELLGIQLVFLSEENEEIYYYGFPSGFPFYITKVLPSQILNKGSNDVEGRLVISIKSHSGGYYEQLYKTVVDKNIVVKTNEPFDLGEIFNKKDASIERLKIMGLYGYEIVAEFITEDNEFIAKHEFFLFSY
ncbi:MAG: hypothetical protein CMH63_00100 [Nanoarchaeota archaeon]|nr:hypothetical protein [Nanoarchaeota archaeon]